jgi:hypothetical protein
MLAWKFLEAGAIAPFTGRPWPRPEGKAPGAWLGAPSGDLARHGVHACRLHDLPLWLGPELWAVELGGRIEADRVQLVAERGRLLRRVAPWTPATAREYAAACAWRARDLALAVLGAAAALRACPDLATLSARAAELAGDAGPFEPGGVVSYVSTCALRAQQGRAPEAATHHANLAAARAGAPAGADAERRWQAEWLGARLGLQGAIAEDAPPPG